MAPPNILNGLFARGAGGTTIVIPPPVMSLLYNSLSIVVLSYGFWDQYADFLQSQSWGGYQGIVESYDFIIVGAGSAGSVLANRLSADPSYQVLLLENGGNPNPMQSVPGYVGAMIGVPQVDYKFHTVPQEKACLAMNDQQSYWPRGKGLGGSSNLNAMFYQRGNPNDFDRWAELSGSDEWKFDNILRHFKNVEDYHGDYYNEQYHSQNGQGVHVSVSSETHLYSEFLEAGREMGYPSQDVNGRQEAAFSRLDVSIKNGRRHGAYQAFIEPILHRRNLKIYRYAHVEKIELDENMRAVGVAYVRHGVRRFVKANKEVIVSSGSVDSPKLLMLSGIGPKQHLEGLGIKCKVNLPVGQNLQDHVMTNLGPFTLETPGSSLNPNHDITLNTVTDYFTHRNGSLSSPGFYNAIAYLYSSLARDRMKSENIPPKKVAPDVQLFLFPSGPAVTEIVERVNNVKTGYMKSYYTANEKRNMFSIQVMIAKYYSRGEIKLASANPLDKPIINPRYFSHPNDIKILTDGMNFTVRLVEETKAFQRHGARLVNKHLPGCEQFPLRTQEYYECYARHLTLTVYHPVGTCSMGKGVGDPKAVVDSKLRVLKTKGLRVVDASIMPEIPNANLNSIVYMIADKASEIILEDWGRAGRQLTFERRSR